MKYLTLENPQETYIIDIETNSLNPSVIWCVVIKQVGTEDVWYFRRDPNHPERIYEEVRQFITEKPEAVWTGHNVTSFDGPVIGRLCNLEWPYGKTVDTLVLSYLYNPGMVGGHSLESYGQRLKFPKGDYSDWTKFTEEMLQYCEQDVRLTEKVYFALTDKMNRIGFSELSAEIEHKIRRIVDVQQDNGFWFDTDNALVLKDRLERRLEELQGPIHELFPPKLVEQGRYEKRYKKDGSDFSSYEKHQSSYPAIVDNGDGTYSTMDWEVFNIGSPKQRLERLLELGFEPVNFTPKGNPKLDEDALVAFSEKSGRPEVALMAEWLVTRGRLNMLSGNPDTGSKGWLDYVLDDHRIHGRLLTCGATTRRMIHSKPNSANIPSGAKAKYGTECRALWGVEPNKGLKQVGVDASGLETVGLLHYLGNKKAEGILTKPKPDDVHSMNARALTEALGRDIDREWGSKTCVPMDTRALTRRGWKTCEELEIGEEILGYNQETGLKEWTTLRGINVCEDEVFTIANSRRVFRATANHKWFVRQRCKGAKSWARVNGRYMEDQIRTTHELNTESSLILNAPFNPEQDKESQVSGLDGKYDVDWEQRILLMSHSERVQFVQGFLLADGHVDKQNGNWHWSQNKGNIAEGLLLASYLVHKGQIHVNEFKNFDKKMWAVSLSAKSHITGSKLVKTSIGVQKVWCPATDLGSWVMRQDDEITITGNSWYAWLYGAYPPKLGQIVKGPPSDGDIIIETFYRNVPGLKSLIKSIQDEWYNNDHLLKTIDGGFVRCPSVNAALNYKIQSLGAIVMKLAAIILTEEAAMGRLKFKLIGFIHDELQMEVKEEDAVMLGELAVICIEEAGRRLGFTVALTGDYKIGDNWSQCH